jgi:hypothetical protein
MKPPKCKSCERPLLMECLRKTCKHQWHPEDKTEEVFMCPLCKCPRIKVIKDKSPKEQNGEEWKPTKS